MSTFVETALESARSQPSDTPLSPEDYLSLLERLEIEAELAREEERRQAHARVWELAKQQGVEPIGDIKDLQGDFWPEEESTDEFLSWLRSTRHEDKHRSIPE
jgi:hypothetical protein